MAGLKLAIVGALIATVASWLLFAVPVWRCGVIFILGFLGMGGLRPTQLLIKNLPRDVHYFRTLASALSKIKKVRGKSPASIFCETASKHPNKTAILFEDQKWTFKDLDNYANKVALLLTSRGIKQGDCIALFMTNCPQYVGILLGAGKLGVKTALINSNLRDSGLYYCITIAESSAVIFESTLEEAVEDIHRRFDENLQSLCFCCVGEPSRFGESFDSAILEQSIEPVTPKQLSAEDVYCYIYTSGTTGLPKAVPIKYRRAASMIALFQSVTPVEFDDVFYTALPLYHTTGGMISMGQCVNGTTIVLRKKFSASNFFPDCIKYKCTVFSYIGELCRYLILQPPAATDTQHSIVKCFGNGLRQEVWEVFQKRFAIPKIIEFYGSTEGNIFLMNLANKPGSVGYTPVWMGFLSRLRYIKVDPTNGELVRNKNGFCIEADVGEQGEMIGGIVASDPNSKFDGYKDEKATSKKILRNVFKTGDQFFRSGDIAKVDEDGFIYFCDRAGDTFRWKGENVSTTEVENIINSCIGQTDVVVYGVEVPNTDGRAGMAAIVGTEESIGITEQLADQLRKALPSYAVPIFIRLIDSTHITGTFKFQKVDYRKEGFDLEKVGKDQVFVLDPSVKKYVPLTQEKYESICNGDMRL